MKKKICLLVLLLCVSLVSTSCLSVLSSMFGDYGSSSYSSSSSSNLDTQFKNNAAGRTIVSTDGYYGTFSSTASSVTFNVNGTSITYYFDYATGLLSAIYSNSSYGTIAVVVP